MHGEVSEAKVVMDKQDPTRSRGFGFVTFATEDGMVSAAAALNSTDLDGRTITVRLEGEERPSDGSGGCRPRGPKHEAFIGGLAWSTTSDSLRAAFARFGEIVDAKVVMDKDEPTKSRGFGFISFATAAALDTAVSQMDGVSLEGRSVRVNKADGGGGGGGGASAATAFHGTGANAAMAQCAGEQGELMGTAYADRFGLPVADSSQGEPTAPKEVANYGMSGKLAAETNTYRGVVLKFSEPPEARIPTTRWKLYIFKGDEPLEPLRIYKQSFFLCGRDRQVADIATDHPSCSKQHAVIQFRQTAVEDHMGQTLLTVNPYVMDLESTNGTFINDERIEPRRYYQFLEKDVLRFGNSSRCRPNLLLAYLTNAQPARDAGNMCFCNLIAKIATVTGNKTETNYILPLHHPNVQLGRSCAITFHVSWLQLAEQRVHSSSRPYMQAEMAGIGTGKTISKISTSNRCDAKRSSVTL